MTKLVNTAAFESQWIGIIATNHYTLYQPLITIDKSLLLKPRQLTTEWLKVNDG